MRAIGLACAILACVVAIVTSGCEDKPKAAAPSPPEAVYTVRGRIVSLPDKPGSSLQIEHEAIANFVRMDGKLGMDSMTMPFPLAKGVSLDGFAAGDIVEVTFEVRWKSQPRSQTTALKKLPADTQLHLGKAGG